MLGGVKTELVMFLLCPMCREADYYWKTAAYLQRQLPGHFLLFHLFQRRVLVEFCMEYLRDLLWLHHYEAKTPRARTSGSMATDKCLNTTSRIYWYLFATPPAFVRIIRSLRFRQARRKLAQHTEINVLFFHSSFSLALFYLSLCLYTSFTSRNWLNCLLSAN